jgi:hypothetical protein
MLRNTEISAKLQKASDISSTETADDSQLKINQATRKSTRVYHNMKFAACF